MNRNFFERPNQSGSRTSSDYGRTHLAPEVPRDPWTRPTIVAIAVIIIYFLWQFAR